MKAVPFSADDAAALDGLIRRERGAKQRDRYRVARHLLIGPGEVEMTREQIAGQLGRSRQFVDEWARRYRRGGIATLRAKKQPGRAPKLTPEQDALLKARLDAGPTPQDKVCTLRGVDIVRIIEKELNVKHTLGGIYDVLRRIDYCPLRPRPTHRKKDPKAVEAFLDRAPFFSSR